jgi:hypothetical protein
MRSEIFLNLGKESLDRPRRYRESHRFKLRNQTDDIFLAQILGHKLPGPNAALSVGRVIRISMSWETEMFW